MRCPRCDQKDERLAKLEAVARALPLAAFDKDPADVDAAEFVDHAAEFLEAMRLARQALESR